MTTVSIIIINYNTFKLTSQCIQSILDHTQNIDYEIILVDNASTECDPNLFKLQFPYIKLIKSVSNLGFSKGNNIGICDANGKYILLLNSDTELLNNAISIAIEKMESDNSIGVISGLLRSPNGQIQATASRFPSIKRELRELFRLNKSFNKEKRSLYNLGEEWNPYEQVEADWVWGTFFLFKKKILDNFQGKLPDKLFMYAEDIDWCWKIKKLGLKIIYYPKAMILHHGGASLPSEMEHSKFYNRMFPNIFLVVAWNTSFIYAYTLYFIRGLHYFTLRNRLDFLHGVKIFKFLFGRKNYWLNR